MGAQVRLVRWAVACRVGRGWVETGCFVRLAAQTVKEGRISGSDPLEQKSSWGGLGKGGGLGGAAATQRQACHCCRRGSRGEARSEALQAQSRMPMQVLNFCFSHS